MIKICIIGSDSFIASRFYDTVKNEFDIRGLYSIKKSGKPNEKVLDLFSLKSSDFDGVDVLINFAAIVHQPKLQDDAIYKKVNTELPIHLAKEAKSAGVKRFIQMSTIAVYGNVTSISKSTPEIPQNIYGLTKLEADREIHDLSGNNFEISIIRPPMVYGGGNAPGNMLSLISAAQKGIPMPFEGVRNERDFIHVDNLIIAIQTVIKNGINNIVIPTDKKPVSSEELILIIKKYSNHKVRLVKIPMVLRKLMKHIKPELYKKVFGDLRVECNLSEDFYSPKYSIEGGIKEMVISLN